MKPDMTNARAAVYALREPLVMACPELTIDRVIADYTVSDATREHERKAMRSSTLRPGNTCHYRPAIKGAHAVNTYEAFYRGKRITVRAETSYKAQLKAAEQFKAKKSYDVTVVLADTPIDPCSLPGA